MHRIMRWAGMGLLFSLTGGVGGIQAQQPVAAEPQASSQTVQAPRELVPTLPVPRLMKFAGTLKDEQGKPRTGAVGVTFAIYKDQEGGAALWLETQNAELDEQGHYTVLLGSTKSEGLPLELFSAGEPRWLGVQVNLPREVEQPRVLLVSVPYALKASDADTVGGLPASAFVLTQPAAGSSGGTQTGTNPKVTSKTGTKSAASPAATISGGGTLNQVTKFTPDGVTIGNSAITEVNGNVGIGYTTPVTKLVVGVPAGGGVLNASNLADQDMFVTVTAPGVADKFAYFGPSTPTNLALGVGSSEKMRITNAGNVGIGVSNPNAKLAIAVPPGALAMNISNLADQDMLVNVTAPGAADKFAFLGPSTATSLALGVGGVEGMRITNAGSVGIGTATTFLSQLEVLTPSAGCVAVMAVLGPQTMQAICHPIYAFVTTASDPRGAILGQGTAGPGVIGASTSGDAVLGTSSSGLAGHFLGNVSVTGTLSKGAGSFKIDHPLDPADKYLSHSFVESPDMMNIYNGNAVLDGNGEAWVQLPEWFEVLNRDFRYQLTAIGAPAPNLYVAEEVSANRFKIAGGHAGGKVSWQVTGIRHDAYAVAHPIVVEQQKPVAERGTYLHPELYGQPKEKGVDWLVREAQLAGKKN